MSNKFSIIIPTMWLSEYLIKMIDIYNRCDLIDDIIIIDNAPNRRVKLTSKKLNIVTKGSNIYVNPAWNWGVSLAKNDNIVIINDDLLFNENDFIKLLNQSAIILKDNMVIGPNENCFNQMGLVIDELKITEVNKPFNYGFGTCMIMKSSSYTIIPDDILIFHGDVIQHKTNTTFLFSGIEIKTPMSVTLKTEPGVHTLAQLDHGKSQKYNKNELKKFKKNG